MDKEIKLSIIVPMYNSALYVERCLDSLVDQGFEAAGEYEVIIVNDGSTDEGPALVARFAESHPEVRLINQENRGQAVARNRGISEARGRYLCFADSDDFLARGRLSRITEAAIKNGAEVLTYSYFNQNTPPNLNNN